MKRVIVGVAGLVLAGCGAQLNGADSFSTKNIGFYGGAAPPVVGAGVVRTAVASETVAQPVVVPETVPVTRPAIASSVVAQNVPVTRLVPMTNIVQVPRVVSQVVPVADAITVPRMAAVPVQRPVVYQQYCSPWVASYGGYGYGGFGYGGLGYGGLGYGGLGYRGFDPNPLINNPLIPGLR